jgi:AcrR family transcriptional regulator
MSSSNGKPSSALTARGQRTQHALISAARVVFERDGFLNARITDIAETAGVAHGSFYSYFTSKEEIFRAAIADLQAELTRGRREQAEEARKQKKKKKAATIRSAVHDANVRYLETWRSHTDLMRLWEDVAVVDETVREMFDATRMAFVRRSEAAISRMQDDGLVDAKLNPRITAFALTAMVSRFAYVWFTRGDDHNFDEAADHLTTLWLNALRIDEKDWDLPLKREGA